MRADRLITTILLLQQRGRMSSRQLAEHLEVSPRTVLRDIEALGNAGVPVYSVRGPHGGFELWRGFTAQLTGISGAEAEALHVLNEPTFADALGIEPARRRLSLKLVASLPPGSRHSYHRAEETFLVVDRSEFDETTRLTIRTLTTAIRRTRELLVTTGANDAPHRIKPLGLVVSGQRWHVVAVEADVTTVYDVDSVRPLRATGATFERPPDFDLAAIWTELSEPG